MIWAFLFSVVLYLFALTGLDRMVTGIIKPDIDRQTFLAYVLWQTVLNQAVALMASLTYFYTATDPNLLLASVIYITVVYCWAGGGLDFLYFGMKGAIPEWSMVWHWMPFKPKTWQFAIYALAWLVGLIVAWATVLGVVGYV